MMFKTSSGSYARPERKAWPVQTYTINKTSLCTKIVLAIEFLIIVIEILIILFGGYVYFNLTKTSNSTCSTQIISKTKITTTEYATTLATLVANSQAEATSTSQIEEATSTSPINESLSQA